MVNNEPIKLQDNLYLYSGDVIMINNSSPLLVVIIENDENQSIKLRNVKDDKYLDFSSRFLSKGKKRMKLPNQKLKFSTDFENALTFTVKKDDNGKMSLQTNDEYLELDDKEFRLSSEEKWLTIIKQQNTENIANYEETIEDINLDKEKEKKISTEESLVVRDFHDNKSGNTSKHTFNFAELKQIEYSFTWSNDLTLGISANLKLNCSLIAGLDIGGKLEKKSSTSNNIKITSNETIQKSLEVICSPWKKMRIKSEIKKTKLLTPYTANIKRVIGGGTYEYLIDGECSREENLSHNSFNEEITTRNILLVGWTGSGKSTLAKVLSGDNDFEESDGSVSKTKFFRSSKEFEWKENYYCVIDNIGFGDNKVSERDVLIRIGQAINSAYQGLSHVLFVFDGRFSDKEKEGFRKLAALKITNSYITLVRSKFDNFYNEDECEEDRIVLEKESPEISQLLNNCRGLLHIDNGDKDSRDDSREKVLDYLNNNCEDNPFKPKEWEDISSLIEDYFKEKEKLEDDKNQANVDQKEAIEQQIDNLKTDTAEKVKEKVKEGEINEFIQVIEIVNK